MKVVDDMLHLQPVEQLLLLCARPVLDAELRRELRRVLGVGVDWNQVLRAAARNFMVVLLRKHVLESAGDMVPAAVVATLNQLRRASALRAMEVMRIQRMLATDLAALPHVFFKGATLSSVYYGDPYLRQYRDIDLLLDDGQVATIGRLLVDRGYVVTNGEWEIFKIPDLVAFCRYNAALELRSPSGITVELHRTLDNSGCVLPADEFIDARRPVAFAGTQMNVLPTAELFVYLCFHHARHKWSSLHWCGDLFAFAPEVQREWTRVSALARRLGLERTLTESVQLRQNLDTLARRGCLAVDSTASKFLADWYAALNSSTVIDSGHLETSVAMPTREPDFPYLWQKTLSYRWRFQLSRLRPSANDFNAWPLPDRWHWLYYLLKPARVLRQRLSGGTP